jgi:hypothetical protein
MNRTHLPGEGSSDSSRSRAHPNPTHGSSTPTRIPSRCTKKTHLLLRGSEPPCAAPLPHRRPRTHQRRLRFRRGPPNSHHFLLPSPATSPSGSARTSMKFTVAAIVSCELRPAHLLRLWWLPPPEPPSPPPAVLIRLRRGFNYLLLHLR